MTGEDPACPADFPAGRDPQRLFSERQRTATHTRQQGMCAVCNEPLPSDFHMHHRTPWAAGGATKTFNAVGVCSHCHTHAPVAALEGLVLRDWQSEAAPVVLARLRGGSFATVAACPGAGKTAFAAHVATELASSGHIDRIVVFVPTTTVRRQWGDTFGRLGIHLDLETRYGTERRGWHGAVLTYSSLSTDETVQALASSVADGRTLVVLDEVHHLGEDDDGLHTAWSARISRIVGTTDDPRTPVLNLTGTPFRSRRNQRISTMDYEPAPGQSDKIQTRTDYRISSNQLIDAGQLRHVSVYQFDTQLRLVDLTGPCAGRVTNTGVVDLSDHGTATRAAALGALLRDTDHYIDPQLDTLLEHLAAQQHLLGHPVKGLVVADDAAHADQVHARLRARIGDHAYIAHSRTDDPAGVLDRFRNMPAAGVLAAVRMVTEGYDAPDITTVVHMTRVNAPLFVHQTVARAMRVTDAERRAGIILPATVMVPADPGVSDAYAGVLVEQMRLLDVLPPCPACSSRPCRCRPEPADKQCATCRMPWRYCVCPCRECGRARGECGCSRRPMRPIDVTVLTRAEVNGINHDGVQVAMDLIRGIDWQAAGVPSVFIPGAAAAVQATLSSHPYDLAVAVRTALPRDAA